MGFKRGWLCLVVAALLLLAACAGVNSDSSEVFTAVDTMATTEAGNTVVPGYFAGVVPWEVAEEDHVVPVSVEPDVELQPGDGKMTMSLSGVPFEVPRGADRNKGASALIDGGDYYYSANVGPSEIQGYTFDPGPGSAFACYELELAGTAPYTVGISWYSLPSEMGSYYLGVGDPQRGVWHWYYGPGDGVLTFDPTRWAGGDIGDTMMICVLLESGLPADFHQLRSGVPEIRGTGLIFDAKAMQAASAPPAEGSREVSALGWATKVDLKPFASPIANQGAIGSCTAFAIAESAFTIMLNEIYGSYGWDVSQADYRSSPMWCYVKSGMSPYGNFDPLCGGSVGRYMNQPMTLLQQEGGPTAATVPYIATSNCSTTFPPLAHTEAEYLKLNTWSAMSSFGLVNSIKEQLAVYNHPVPIAMYGLENAFLNYTSGVYHYGGTQGVNGGHAMCIVGFDDELEAFEVRNSWGSGWGAGGYWWCGYDAVTDLAAEQRFGGYSMDAIENPAAVEYFFDEEVPGEYDEVEPNNNNSQASALPEFFFTGYSGFIDSEDIVDVFSFDYAAGSNTTVTVAYNSSQTRMDVRLLDANGQILANATGAFGNQVISGVWSADGTAYIALQCIYGSGQYSIDGNASVPPVMPTGFTAETGTTGTGILLSWDTVENTTNYTIQRAADAAGPYSQLATTYETTYADMGSQLWTTYWYRVMAVNGEGTSLPSSPASAHLAIAPPNDVAASDSEYDGKVVVSWSLIPAADEYTVMRGTSAQGPFVTLGNYPEGPVDDVQIVENTIYYYVVCCSHEGLFGPVSIADAGSAGGGLVSPEDVEVVPGDTIDDIPVNDIGDGTLDPGGIVVTN